MDKSYEQMQLATNKRVSTYPRNTDAGDTTRARKEAVAWSVTLRLQNPHEAPLHDNGTIPLAELPVLDGYCCQGCEFLTISQKQMRRYRLRASHHVTGDALTSAKLQSFSNRLLKQ